MKHHEAFWYIRIKENNWTRLFDVSNEFLYEKHNNFLKPCWSTYITKVSNILQKKHRIVGTL